MTLSSPVTQPNRCPAHHEDVKHESAARQSPFGSHDVSSPISKHEDHLPPVLAAKFNGEIINSTS